VATVKVWDAFVRIAHWSLVATIVAAWLTQEGSGRVHEWVGYAALVIVAARVGWGFVGPPSARFRSFVRPLPETFRYARAALRAREPRHLGHNPLGGWMIVALLLMITATGVTGWLYTTTMFWGDARMEAIHEACADALLLLAALHVAGVLVACIRHRENLVKAMFSGRKRDLP
jgi:cytochrome b